MKLKQKIGFSLVLITALLAGLFFSHSSSAAPSFSAAWIDRSNIQVTGNGKTAVLTDGSWDAEWKYQGKFEGCSDTSTLDGFGGLIVGFSDNNSKTSPSAWNDSVSNADSLVVKYKAAPTETSCTTAEVKPVHIDNWQNARMSYRWTDGGHTSITRIDRGGDWTFAGPKNIPSGEFDAGKTRFFRQSETGDTCQDVIDVSADGGTMWLYEQVKKSDDINSGVLSPVDSTNCKLKSTINHLYSTADIDEWMNSLPSNFALPLGEPFIPPGDGGGDGSGVGGTNDACYKSGWALSWIACPVITAAQTAANAMYGFVEDQLKFTVLQNCTTVPNCSDSLGEEHDNVHSAWNNFRILVSGLVVILLLVMVISQAIGSGPFDAYTVRKMLPRLVAGVILIQISWPLFSWVVNTVDDLGRGLADIMYAPFGGSDALGLNSIMSGFKTEGTVFSWVGIPALIIFGVVAPFIVLGMILTVLVALLAGFLTLLFRKIIIILALIFVPIALVSWMMPNDGLRKYWKLWWDNFLKALMMFPLIIAIIAAGRIFAKIGSAQIDFVGFFIVLIGFFGPLFILPKTFKWGGTVMTMAGNGINKAQERTMKKPKEFLGERQKGYSAERTRQSQERFTRGVGFGLNRNWRTGFGIRNVPESFREHGASLLWRRPVDLVRSGTVDPTLLGRRREEAIRGYRAAGAESEEKETQQADRDFGILASLSENHDDFAAQVGGADVDETITFNDRFGNTRRLGVTRAMKRAGMNGIAKFGTDRGYRTLAGIMNDLNHGDAEDQFMAERFRDTNVATLKPKMDYLYRGQSRAPHGSDEMPDWDVATGQLRGPIISRIDALAPGQFVQMEAPDLEALLAGLSQIANHHPHAPARAEAVRYLAAIDANWRAAIDNDQIRPNIGPSVNLTMKAFHDGTFLPRRNADRAAAGLTTGMEPVAAVSSAAAGGRVSNEGVVT